MALFTVFGYKRRPPVAIPAVMDALTAAAHVQPELLVRATLPGRRPLHAHVLSTTTAVLTAAEQVHLGPDLTVVHGHPFRAEPGGAARPFTAAEVARAAEPGLDLAEVDRWAGDFALCHVDGPGVLTVLSDLHRIQNVFWIDTPWLFAVSTRPSLLRLLAGDPGLAAETIAAISATGYAFGDATIHEGVRTVPQGMALRWDGQEVSLLPRDRVVDRPAARGLDLDDSWTRRQLDDGIAQAAASIELANRTSDTIDLGITGGKDSRVVLALALAHGFGPRLRTYSRGPENHPDVVVGRMLAERAGVPHRVIPPPAPPADEPALAQAYLARLARHTYLVDGLVGGWDAFAGNRTGTGIAMTGVMGETLKAYAKKPYSPTEQLDPAAIVNLQSPFDPMQVLTPWGRQVIVERLGERFTALLDAGYTHADLPDLYYYENRIPNWLGHSKQVYTFTVTQVAPLGSVPLARLAFRATAAERKAELIHYLLVRQAAPQLLDVPFALQTWDPSLPGAPVRDPVPMPPAGKVPVRLHGTWQYAADQLEVRKALRAVIRETRHPAVWEAVDKARLLKQLNTPKLGMNKLISALGIVTMAMYAEGRFEDAKIVATGSADPPTPYAFTPAEPGPEPRRVLWGRRGGARSGWVEV